jgi:hypothetical protein
MGKRDSTKTRVIPLFNEINNSSRKINDLINMMSKAPDKTIDFSHADIYYGCSEKRLKPSTKILEWLVLNLKDLINGNESVIPRNYGVSKMSPSYDKRRNFFNDDINTFNEALKLVQKSNLPKSGWYIFEGYTAPDIYIETKEYIIVGEAKRTENHLTTSTMWLQVRDQLIRHIDAVIDSGKEVLSFFIFDRKVFNKNYENKMCNYDKFEYYRKSLPHRDDQTIQRVLNTFIGYTFWDDVAKKFNPSFLDTI